MIDPTGITVWAAATDALPDGLWPRLEALLDPGERRRAAAFAFDRDRRPFQAAQALKRLMLTAAVGGRIPPAAWRFEIGPKGKPFVAGGAGPAFNLSHTAGLAAVAVSRRCDPGLDVERLDRSPPDPVDAFLTPAEAAWLARRPANARGLAFFRLWTLKEALIKATGEGLSRPLASFSVRADPPEVTPHDPDLSPAEAWRFVQSRIGPHHVLALAWRDAGDLPVAVREVRLGDLLGG